MALTCARCGNQNPDGNAFCQVCGTPLAVRAQPSAVAAPPPAPVAAGGYMAPPPAVPPPRYVQGPPPGMAPPMVGPTGYQSPYYSPSAPGGPVHRTPWMLIIAGVVGLIVLMAGCGTALAVLGNRASSSNNNTSGTTISDLPSPSPAVTPTPVASPIATPSTNPSGGASESNDGVIMPVPAGWTVANKDGESIVLTDPNSEGSVTAASGTSSPVQTAVQNKTTLDDYFKQNYPDTRLCPGTTVANTSFNGAKGISWALCFTLTAGGHSVAAAASLFAGANSSGSVYYVVMVITRQDNLKAYITEAKPVLSGIHWKLS
jgi:zinc-ribbon domain